VTNFGSKHPGGEDFLMAAVGRDATAVFESFHSPKAIKVLAYVRNCLEASSRHTLTLAPESEK
jgi:cytochrome b involved in lipid metabolism